MQINRRKRALSDRKNQNLGRTKVMAKVMMLQGRKKTKNLYQEKENENKMSKLEKQFY